VPEERIVIIGAGLAGMSAADTLRAQGFDGTITLVGDEAHLPYTKPPLSKQFLRGEMQAHELALRPASWYEERNIDLVLGRAATKIDTARRTVTLAAGEELPYDRALVTTGGSARKVPVAGSELEGVHTLRTIEDAVAIRERLQPGSPVVVVGAGFIGAEVAASARMLGCEVTILEVAALPLSRVLGAEVGRLYTDLHASHGVRVRCGVGLDEIRGGTEVTHVVGTDGSVYEATEVVVGVGIVPNDVPARGTDVRVENGLVVDEWCQTHAAGVYAAGDLAFHPNAIAGRSLRIEQWQNAQHQGQAAARNMIGVEKPFSEVPWFWSDQYDINLQMAGLPTPGSVPVFRGDVEGYQFSVFYLRDGVLEAVVGLNRVLDVRAGRKLIARRARITAEALADESVDLLALGAGAVTT
jgi:3-phenylpropionate/trans-cinnamate dioxygenase ferredoxin reductase subunit